MTYQTSKRSFLIPFYFGAALQIIIFIFLCISPMSLGDSLLSPLVSQYNIPVVSDMSFYVDTGQSYANLWDYIKSRLSYFFSGSQPNHNDMMFSPPILPLLTIIFLYPKYPILLSLFFLLSNLYLKYIILKWFDKKKLPIYFMFLFLLIPHHYVFSLFLNPSILYAIPLFMYFTRFADHKITTSTSFTPLFYLSIVMTCIRPNGFIFLLFTTLLYLFIHRHTKQRLKKQSIILVLIIASFFITPYAVVSFFKGYNFSFFNIPTLNYLSGIYPFLPKIIDIPLSIVSLLISKISYFIGIRPSYSEISSSWTLIRSLSGIIFFFPGVIYLLVNARKHISSIFIIGLFTFPYIFGPINERYFLPILPIIFLFSCLAYKKTGKKIKHLVSSN